MSDMAEQVDASTVIASTETPKIIEKVVDESESDDEIDNEKSDEESGIRSRNKKRELEVEDNVSGNSINKSEEDEGGVSKETTEEDDEEMKRRAKRAARFDIKPEPVIPPPVYKYTQGIDPALPWSERKRLMVMQKSNNQWGDQKYVAPVLEAGFNPYDEKEKIKSMERLKKFQTNEEKMNEENLEKERLEKEKEEIEKKMKIEKRSERFGIDIPSLESESKSKSVKSSVEQDDMNVLKILRLKPDHVYTSDEFRKDPPFLSNENDEALKVSQVGVCRNKLHLFVLHVDKQNFTKFRSPDLIHYLKAYNPTYVEWLNDRSCNIHFPDEVSAMRAYNQFFKSLPPYDKVIESQLKTENIIETKKKLKNQMLNNMNSVLKKAVDAASAIRTKHQAGETETGEANTTLDGTDENDKTDEGKAVDLEEKAAELKEEVGQEETKDKAELITEKDETNEEDTGTVEPVEPETKLLAAVAEDEVVREEEVEEPVFVSRTKDFSDLGSMNWKIGPPLATQKGNGKLSCRVICRFAYDFDVLIEKPKPSHTSYGHKGGKKFVKNKKFNDKRKAPSVNLNSALPSSYRSGNQDDVDVSNIKIKVMKKN